MGNKIFEALLSEKIDIFKNSFSQLTMKLFYDSEQKKLIHPAEYGMYRESICKEFLRFIVPRSLEIDQGFLINNTEEISTQCDILIYDANSTPLIENSDRQRFFPVETVCAIGEVKSTLSKTKFKEAIRKLSLVKPLKTKIKNPFIIKSDNKTFDTSVNYKDNLCTFLICQKLDFNLDNICNEFEDLYKDIDTLSRHNVILSIEDGIFLYKKNNTVQPYPSINQEILKNRFIIADENNSHLKIFASNLFLTTSAATILHPELGDYILKSQDPIKFNDQN